MNSTNSASDAKVMNLRPGAFAVLVSTKEVRVDVRRSTCGKTLTYSRHTANKSEVFKRCAY